MKLINLSPVHLYKMIKVFAEIGEVYTIEESLGIEVWKYLKYTRGKKFKRSYKKLNTGEMTYINIWRVS